VVPVFNQQNVIAHHLLQIAESADVEWELIVIDDASTDLTLAEVLRIHPVLMELETAPSRVRVFRNTWARFETYCDSFGIEVSDAAVVIEIQADMCVEDRTFMSRLSTALSTSEDLFMVSGRGTQPFSDVVGEYRRTKGSDRVPSRHRLSRQILGRALDYCYRLTHGLAGPGRHRSRPQKVDEPIASRIAKKVLYPLELSVVVPEKASFEQSGRAGRLDETVAVMPIYRQDDFNRVWVGETVIRGPLAINKSRYLEVGGFDKKRFFLGYDDHDLALRGLLLGRYRVGFCPVVFVSPMEIGTTRKPRSLRTEILIRLNLWRIRSAGESALDLYEKKSNSIPKVEIRPQ
jgi:glycosyltransferase involved in cell wall biosynthesis